MVEKVVFTAFNNATAKMLVEKLSAVGIPARLGNESDLLGVGMVEGSRVIIVPEEYEKEAKEIIEGLEW